MAGEKKCCRSSRQRVYTASRREAVMEIQAKNQARASMSVQRKNAIQEAFFVATLAAMRSLGG